jgi:glycosyltransferase involved in cell wall biosynthesis
MPVRAWLHAPRESWIVDRLVGEFSRDNAAIVTDDRASANVLWFMAGWCIDQLGTPRSDQRIISTVHHLVPGKRQQWDHVIQHDARVDAYHVPNIRTRDALLSITQKPVHVIPYWVSSQVWPQIAPGEREMARASLGIGTTAHVIASFQRDSEGNSGYPKLEKGPDILCDYIERIAAQRNVIVLLAGYRRQYVVHRLDAANVRYIYIEHAPAESMRWLYAAADVYVVASRCEGGPQALLECAALGVPVISTPVGMAETLLHPSSISHELTLAVPNVVYASSAIAPLLTPRGYEPYVRMLTNVMEVS